MIWAANSYPDSWRRRGDLKSAWLQQIAEFRQLHEPMLCRVPDREACEVCCDG